MLQPDRKAVAYCMYRVVQLDLIPEIEVIYICLINDIENGKLSMKQRLYSNFRCKI